MEQALYHPRWGYYSSGRARVGRGGDYFTSVSVGALFGQMLAAQFAEMWKILGRPDRFTIVEQGANNGAFAADVLCAMAEDQPACFAALRYEIVEPFPALRLRQETTLTEFREKITWRESLRDLPPFVGLHFSNELLDALPVHLLRRVGADWHELFVDEGGGELALMSQPIGDATLAVRANRLPPLPPGYQTEISSAIPAWIELIAHKLERGFLLAVDYGHSRDEFYSPARDRGTLRGYRAHAAVASPLEQIGDADITAHVDWTSLAEFARERGFGILGFTDQHHFLSALATGLCADYLTKNSEAKTRRMLQTLLHPTFLGRTFQFLALTRDLPRATALDGFRLAPDGLKRLGLE